MLTLTLPPDIQAALAPLFEALPLEQAMQRLVATEPRSPDAVLRVEQVVSEPALAARPLLQAGLWLYVDALDRSHRISQQVEDATGAFWHGIMHRREGDFDNSHYWFRRVGKHPVVEQLAAEGYEPHALIDQVHQAVRAGKDPAELVQLQQREWAALFAWCGAR